ncbi:MAG: hypothetical protein D4R84_13980, partial [Rhodocyclaceae bacterium]
MTRTLSEIFGWVKSKILSYFLIVAILLAGVWAQGEIKKIGEKENLLKTTEAEIQKIDEQLRKFRSGIDPLSRVYARAMQRQLDKEMERSEYKAANPFMTWVPFTEEWKHMRELDFEVALSAAAAVAAERAVGEKVRALSKAKEAQVALKAEYDKYLEWARKWKALLPTFW